MASASRMVMPAQQGLLHLEVLRTERLAPHWMRVTLGGGEIGRFVLHAYVVGEKDAGSKGRATREREVA